MTVFTCEICKKKISSLASCIDHVYTHRSPRNSCCVPGCRYTSARLTKHLKGKHRDLCEHPCGACNKVFVREVDLRHHSKALHGGVVSRQHRVHDSSTSRGETSNQSGRNRQLNTLLHRGFTSHQHHSNTSKVYILSGIFENCPLKFQLNENETLKWSMHLINCGKILKSSYQL